jgi:hypothetical protein
MERATTQRKIPLAGSSAAAIEQEVEDALRASPEQRMRAVVTLLDTSYDLLRRQGMADGETFCRFPGCIQERRPGPR